MRAPRRGRGVWPAGAGWRAALLAAAALLGLWFQGGGRALAANPPTLTAVSPTTGPLTGGTAVTLTGTDFVTGATVTFNGVPATGVLVPSATQITATTPAGAVGPAVIVVTNPDTQGASLSGAFSYLNFPPAITLVSPATGGSLGGATVTISGSDFVAGATVTLGGGGATSVTFDSPTQLTATTTAHAVGAVAVVVTNPDGQSDTVAGGYTYSAAPAPTVTSVAPSSGTTGGGTPVTGTGTGFGAGASVTFDGVAATNVVVASATSITATTPAHSAGTVTVVVTNPDTQVGTLLDGYSYAASAAPAVTGVAPGAGSLDGGTAVTITGSGFLSGATVDFGGAAATAVTVAGTTTITATTPAHTPGKVAVKVTNTDTLSGSLSDGFEYLAAPTLTAADPALGSSAGGTEVKLTGTGFVSGATVTFGALTATSVSVVSATEISAVAAAHAAGAVDVVVTNPDTQSATLSGKFSYTDPPLITVVVPGSGTVDGGSEVTIAGSGFAAGATVKFGDVAATDVTITSDSLITAKTPVHASGVVSVTVTNTDGLGATLAVAFTYKAPVAPSITAGVIPTSGFAFIVFSGGSSQQLVDAAVTQGCDAAKARFWATSGGQFVPYIPASKVEVANAAWNALFANGIGESWPLVATCG